MKTVFTAWREPYLFFFYLLGVINGVKRPYKKKNYSREKKLSQQMSFSEIFLLNKIKAPIFQIIYIRNKTLNPSVNGGLKQKRKVQIRLQGL